jgi:carboxyl-terminal processing protease
MQTRTKLLSILIVMLISILACTQFNLGSNSTEEPTEVRKPTPTAIVEGSYKPDDADENEPILVTGTIPFTSPFFIDFISEPFIMLEDQAGFVARDKHFEFALAGQTIGPVWQIDDQTMEFSLSLPSVPQATLLDVDNDGSQDKGVMIFQVALWSNTWDGPFLEEREGTGWSNAYTSALTDPERDGEIYGGTLLVWAPDDQQSFPTGFGSDNMLFTEDDPVQSIPSGYSLVNLDSEPFSIYKESNPELTLVEGPGEVKDFSSMSRAEAFDAMFERVRLEYPFTQDKDVDWDALYAEYAPKIEAARSSYAYYQVLHEFIQQIPDGHVGMGFTDDAAQYLFDTNGGSLGMILAELSDGRVIVTKVYPGYAAEGAGIQVGAEITSWEGQPILDAIDQVVPFFGPYSTPQAKRLEQLVFLTRFPPDTQVTISYKNPGGAVTEKTLTASVEYDSLLEWIPWFTEDPVSLPVEAKLLDNNIAYMKIGTFADDQNLTAQVYEHYIQNLIDSNISGLILDMRVNGGGDGSLADNFAAYFINQEIVVSQRASYNHDLGEFEYGDEPKTVEPAPLYYDGQIVVLVSPYCVSACEGFTYLLTLNDRATIVGHAGTAGAYGDVGLGQYTLPGDIDMQFPTGRPETMDGQLLIEGTGILPDVTVLVTYESALGQEDVVLNTAIQILTGQ